MTEQLWGSNPTGITKVSANFSRPNNADQYAAGDVVGTDPATVMEFEECARVDGQGGQILGARIIDSANQVAKLSAELWLFSVAPAGVADNAAFAPSDAELNNLVCIIPISTAYVGNAGAGATGNAVIASAATTLAFKCGGSTRSLFGVLVARNAYTPVAQEGLRVQIDILQG